MFPIISQRFPLSSVMLLSTISTTTDKWIFLHDFICTIGGIYLYISPTFLVNSIPFSWCILTTGWFYECWHDFIFNSFISFSNTVCWHYSLDTLFTYFIQYQISQGEAVFLRVNYWAGLPHIHLDDKVRRFSLYPPNVVRNRPNVRAVILSNNIIK